MKKFIQIIFLIVIFFTNNFANGEEMNHIEKVALMKQLCFHSLIISKDEKITTSNERGLIPLLTYLDNSDLNNAYAFDRTVGRAAAWLYVYGNVEYVYADTISKPAAKILKKHKIKYEYTNLVDEILNRPKTDLCPFEKLTKNIDNPTIAYGLIYQKIYPDTSVVYFTPDTTFKNLLKIYKTLKGNIVYINVVGKLSVDCDSNDNSASPEMTKKLKVGTKQYKLIKLK